MAQGYLGFLALCQLWRVTSN